MIPITIRRYTNKRHHKRHWLRQATRQVRRETNAAPSFTVAIVLIHDLLRVGGLATTGASTVLPTLSVAARAADNHPDRSVAARAAIVSGLARNVMLDYVTDSAASGFGWATGQKTYDGAISVRPDGTTELFHTLKPAMALR